MSSYVRDAIDEACVYATLAHTPDVAASFLPPASGRLDAFERGLDVSFFNVFNQPCGYYQLKRFAATIDQAAKLSFVEDATEYRLIEDAGKRAER